MDSLPKNAGIVRIHVAGDFFSADYMQAWYNVAMSNPTVLFYAYTKSLTYWNNVVNEMPILNNFVLTASYGGQPKGSDAATALRALKGKGSYSRKKNKALAIA